MYLSSLQWAIAAAVIGLLAGCRVAPPVGPVPVQGTEEAVSEVAGEWSGRYWSKETGRRGIIRFSMPEHADSGYGEVEITFSPALRLARASSAADGIDRSSQDELEPKPCTTLAIKLVRVGEGRVQGTIAPYWDPDCDCRAQTSFEGTILGDRISGKFSSRRESSDRRILTGVWYVDRQD